jgi:formylglycine-generating enzyme required for sulfatase activity
MQGGIAIMPWHPSFDPLRHVSSDLEPSDSPFLYLGPGLTVELVRIPAGEFLMGSGDIDTLADIDEEPQHVLWLPEYLIGKYPVTVAQYRAFVHATHDPVRPLLTSAPDDHPVVSVNWFEALAFCRWASEASGRSVQLPSEAEWEKAACWDEAAHRARIYPWGDPWDPARCNTRASGLGRTTPVGYYSPLGDSPYGCADMAGNVWEWTRSLWGRDEEDTDFGYPYDPVDGREDLGADRGMLRVVRGGSFYDTETSVRCAFRCRYPPSFHFDAYGFRVAVTAGSL